MIIPVPVMMTSSNGNIFRVTGPLCWEFTGPGEFPTQRPVTRSFDVFFDLRLNKRLSKQPWGWWFETLSWSLWRHRNEWNSHGRHGQYSILILNSINPRRNTTTCESLLWRHNDHDGVSNHQPHGCLLNCLFRRRSKKTSKLRVTGLCVGNSPGPVNSPHKWPVTRKCFHLMTSSCRERNFLDVLYTMTPFQRNRYINWGILYQKQVSRPGTSNYIPQYLWDAITYACPLIPASDTILLNNSSHCMVFW